MKLMKLTKKQKTELDRIVKPRPGSALDDLLSLQKFIPKDVYCYDENGTCPFWEMQQLIDDSGSYETGYCYYLQCEDCILLWDQCKICGINEDNVVE